MGKLVGGGGMGGHATAFEGNGAAEDDGAGIDVGMDD